MTRSQRGAIPSALDSALRLGDIPNLFPRKSGQYYSTTHTLQSINTDANAFGTSGTKGYLLPVAVTEVTPIDRFGINVSTAGGAGSNIRMAFYPHDTAWGTVSKIVSGSMACDTTGDKAVTISATLMPAFYWMLVATTDTSGTLIVRRAAGFGGTQGDLGGGVTFFSTEWALQYNSLTLTSDAPATINLGGASTYAVNDVPLGYFRKA